MDCLAMGFDWFNYGGITRSVVLIETSPSFIEDYFIQLKKHSDKEVLGWVRLAGTHGPEAIRIRIPELNLDYKTISDSNGLAVVDFKTELKLWSPATPKLYKLSIQSVSDTLSDNIGFRNIEVNGTSILA